MIRKILMCLLVSTMAQAGTNLTWNNTAYVIPAAGEINWQSLSAFLVALGNNAQTTNFQKVGVRIATTTPVSTLSSDSVIVVALAAPGASTVDLPAGSLGRALVVIDGTGDAGTNNITVDGSGAEAINGAGTLVMNKDRQAVHLVWNGTEWSIASEYVAEAELAIAASQLTGQVAIANGGTGQSSKTSAFDALSPNTTNGDFSYYNGTDNVRLAPGTTTQVLHSGTPPTWGAVALTSQVSGALPVANGGTGQTTLTSNGVVVGNGASAVTVTAAGAANTVLRSGTPPAFGKVDLATDITGTFTVANGGTGVASLSNNGVVVGNGTGPVSVTAAGTTGTVLKGVSAGDPVFGTVGSAEITDGSIVNADVNASAGITYSKLLFSNNIIATDLAPSSVGTSEITDNSILSADINASAAIPYSKLLFSNNIDAGDLAADSVGVSEIAANAVGNSEMLDNAIGNAEMLDNAIGSAEVVADSLRLIDINNTDLHYQNSGSMAEVPASAVNATTCTISREKFAKIGGVVVFGFEWTVNPVSAGIQTSCDFSGISFRSSNWPDTYSINGTCSQGSTDTLAGTEDMAAAILALTGSTNIRIRTMSVSGTGNINFTCSGIFESNQL